MGNTFNATLCKKLDDIFNSDDKNLINYCRNLDRRLKNILTPYRAGRQSFVTTGAAEQSIFNNRGLYKWKLGDTKALIKHYGKDPLRAASVLNFHCDRVGLDSFLDNDSIWPKNILETQHGPTGGGALLQDK